jgi:hypothetical protein
LSDTRGFNGKALDMVAAEKNAAKVGKAVRARILLGLFVQSMRADLLILFGSELGLFI